MKKLMAIILSIVAVFCVFASCSGNSAQHSGNNDAAGINTEVPDGAKDGENQGNGNGGTEPDDHDDGTGENVSDGAGETDPNGTDENDPEEQDKEKKPKYVPVDPISDGGDFAGGNYN